MAHDEYYTPDPPAIITPRIEKNAPIPKAKRHSGEQVRGEMRKLLTSLRKGECLIWPIFKEKGDTAKSVRSRVRSCASNVRREFPDRTFVVRTFEDDVRIWRIM